MNTPIPQWLELGNGTNVQLLYSDESHFLGLGAVVVKGVPLRSGQVPLRPFIKSVGGVQYTRFALERIESLTGGGVALHTRAIGEALRESAYGDEYDALQWNVSVTGGVVSDQLTWLLRPEQIQIGDLAYVGFSYAWRFASPTEKIFRMVVQATWEIGGRATGNTILSQGQVTPPVYTAATETHFTSACLKGLNRFGDPQGMSFQLAPRWSPHQCFDFIAAAAGSLVGCWLERADVRSFVQKNPGEEVIFVIDAMQWAATKELETPRKHVLFAASERGPLPEHEQRNRWKDAYDFCTEAVRALFHIQRSRPLPEVSISYDQRLESDGTFRLRVGDRWVASREWLSAIADDLLPRLAARGSKRVITEPICETDPTERGRVCKLNIGLHGDLNVGSVCCVHRYRPAEFFGGLKAWRDFYEAAHRLGLEVGHWVGPHLAYHAPILQQHPDWAMRGANTLPVSGGYPNFVLASLNWNTPVRQWILEDLKRWKEAGGLDYIWFDSIGNLGLFPVDYARAMQPNAVAVAEFIADLQSIGIANILLEGTGPLGIGAMHVFDPNQGAIRHAQEIVGQNTFDWYVGNEDMLGDQAPRVEVHPERSDAETRQIVFRCLANRCVPAFGRFSRDSGPAADWFKSSLDSYFVVEPDLVRRRLLPDRQGVLWTDGKANVLFAFRSFRFELDTLQRVERVAAGKVESVSAQRVLTTEPWSVYRLAR